LWDTFDLFRVKRAIEALPESEIIIIASNKTVANEYWKRIKQQLNINKRPWIISNANTNDGLPFLGALILKIDRWWENKNATFVMEQSRVSKLILPITYIPPHRK